MAAEAYTAQVGLLVQVLPFVAQEACFALKGGTAINLFYRVRLVNPILRPTMTSPWATRRAVTARETR